MKPDGKLIVIDEHLYCWRSPDARGNPKRVWQAKLPALPEALHAKGVRRVGGETSLTSWREGRTEYSLTLYLDDRDRAAVLYLATDEQGRAIAVQTPKEQSLWQVIKDAERWRESRTDPDDSISVFEFRSVGGPEKGDYLGLAEKPITVKDEDGKDQDFFPLILVDATRALQFAYNDYSGK